MKKLIMLVLTLVLALGLVGCNNSKSAEAIEKDNETISKFALTQEIEVIFPDKSVELREEDAETLLKILENGKWEDGIPACATDYTFLVSGITIRYHSECGTFNDSQSKRGLSTDQETQQLINDILKRYSISENN